MDSTQRLSSYSKSYNLMIKLQPNKVIGFDCCCVNQFCVAGFSSLKTAVPFVTAHLDIFHSMHHPMSPKSDLYFTFCSTLNALSKTNIKVIVNGLLNSFGKWNEPSTPLNGCEINVCF